MKRVTTKQAYENLANAIILQAIKDYNEDYKKEECLHFFRSQWFSELTAIPGSAIIRLCEEGRTKFHIKW